MVGAVTSEVNLWTIHKAGLFLMEQSALVEEWIANLWLRFNAQTLGETLRYMTPVDISRTVSPTVLMSGPCQTDWT